jgi:hypothetical protein
VLKVHQVLRVQLVPLVLKVQQDLELRVQLVRLVPRVLLVPLVLKVLKV